MEKPVKFLLYCIGIYFALPVLFAIIILLVLGFGTLFGFID